MEQIEPWVLSDAVDDSHVRKAVATEHENDGVDVSWTATDVVNLEIDVLV